MDTRAQKYLLGLIGLVGSISCGNVVFAQEDERELLELDPSCIINVLNRTVSVQSDGTWFLTNVPSNMGQIRARATCIRDGSTERGASDYFSIQENQFSVSPDIYVATEERVPSRLEYFSPGTSIYSVNEDGTLSFNQFENLIFLSEIGETYQASVNAYYPDGEVEDVTSSSSGINYTSTNAEIASVNSNGLIEAVSPGNVSIVARKDEVLTLLRITVDAGDDTDGDGLPDEYETNNGLNPNDPVDAQEDIDNDGLTALEEFEAGTNIYSADTDGDGISDSEELSEGDDGVVTNPLLNDSDGDLITDLAEISVGTDPNDVDDNDFEAAIVSIRSTPSSIAMTFNTIDSEVSTQLSISATLVDGNIIDVTSTSFGTDYASGDLSIASFGTSDGEIFGGAIGETSITISLFDLEITVPVVVESFQPEAISQLLIDGNGVDTEVQGDFVYVAATTAGVHIVNTAQKESPMLVTTISSASGAVDTKIDGDVLYIARGSAGIDIYDVSDKSNPVLLGNYLGEGSITDLGFENSVLMAGISSGGGGVEFIDVSDPNVPLKLSYLSNLTSILSVDFEEDTAVAVNRNALLIIDIGDLSSPQQVGSINIGNLRAVVIEGDYAYIACYTCGYKIVDISDPSNLSIVGTGAGFYPSDVALTNGLAFFSDILFTNAVPYVNIFNPLDSVFQGIIDLTQFGDRDAYGLSLDSGYVYSTGSNRLYISQYRMLNDTQGVAPTVDISSPLDGDVVVERSKIQVQIDAVDDIAVSLVQLLVNDEVVRTDTTLPYEISYTIPEGITAIELEVNAIDFGNNVGSASVLLSVEPDADEDGLGDDEEVNTWMTDPNNPDSDDDGLLDGDEARRGTDPNEVDSDQDGIEDGVEVANDTDPNNPDITPPTVIDIDPELDAIDICENSSVMVTLSEVLRRNTINNNNVKLYVTDTAEEASVSLSLVSSDTEILINPSAILLDNTNYTVSIENVRDDAGNLISEQYTSTFTTGNCIDVDRPFLVSASPINNSSEIGVNARITALLSEPIQPDTVTSDSFYVYDQSSGQRIDGTIEVTADNSALVFTPNIPFLVGRRHYVIISSSILDLFDNNFVSTSISFTTKFEADSTGPQLMSTSVEEGQNDVPTNLRLTARFDEQVNALFLDGVQLLDAIGDTVPASLSLSSDRQAITLSPTNVLDNNSSYTFVVQDIQDISGNLLASRQDFQFTTSDQSDTTTGTLIASSVPNYVTNYPRNGLLEFKFSEPIDPTSITENSFYLYEQPTARRIAGTIELLENNTKLTFTPDEILGEERLYYLYIGYSPFLQDLSGNNIAQNTFRALTTGLDVDEQAPNVTTTSIFDGASDIPVNSVLTLRFDSPISDACDFSEAITISDGSSEIDATFELDNTRTSMVVAPNDLSTSTNYQVSITGLCDYAGNIIDDVSFAFTTSDSDASDTTAPSLSSITPANRATDVSITSDIVATLNENVSADSIIALTGGGVTVNGQVSVVDNQVTFTPDEPLKGNTTYTINLRYNIKDLAGNVRWLGTTTFTTQEVDDTTSPTVSAISPSNGASDVNPLQDIVLNFSEPLTPNSISTDNLAVYSNGVRLSTSVFSSADGRDITITSSLPSNSIVSLVVTSGVTDLSGNPVTPFISSFITGTSSADFTRPRIVKQVPSNGSSGLLDTNEIYFYTDEALDPSTLDDAFNLAQDGVLIDADIEVLGDGRTIKVSADENFNDNALVQMYWSSDATDMQGNPLYDYQTYFNTGDSGDKVGERPNVIGFAPNSSNRNVALNAKVYIAFDEPISESSLVIDDNVLLYDASNGFSLLPISVALDDSQELLIITPQDELVADNSYYVQVNSSILDTDGDNLSRNSGTYFYTSDQSIVDDRAPMVMSFTPNESSENVGTLPQFSFTTDESINRLTFVKDDLSYVQFSEFETLIRYEYLAPLEPSQTHEETLPIMSDFANNMVTSSTYSFTTDSGPDLSEASIAETSILSNQTDIPTNSSFAITYNESIQAAGVLDSNAYIYDSINGQTVETTKELSPDGRKLTLTPVSSLLSGRRYYAYVHSQRDISGNSAQAILYYFTTSFEQDVDSPMVEATTVIEGQTNVPVNVRLNVKFNEPMDLINEEGIVLYDNSDNIVPTNISISRSRTLLTIVPKALLQPLSTYRLSVDSQQDISGNALQNGIDISFTTSESADLIRGDDIAWNIESNYLTISRNPLLTVTFDESIDPATLDSDTSYLYNANTGLRVDVDLQLSDDLTSILMTPVNELRAGGTYYWYLGYSPYLTDLAGNLVAQNNFRVFYTNTEIDNTAPQVLSTNIDDGDTEIPINGRAMFNFDERLGSHCIGGSAVASDGINEIDVTISLTNSQSSLIVNANDGWEANTSYTVTLTGLCDYSGNQIEPLVLSFTTQDTDIADTTAPTVTNITPINNETGVSVDLESIVVTFSENIDLATQPVIRDTNSVVPGEYEVIDNQLIFTPSIALKGGLRHQVELASTVFDLAGNVRYLGIYYFTTEEADDTQAPMVENVSPSNGASDVDPSQAVVVSFSEAINNATLTNQNIALYADGSVIRPTISRSLDGSQVTLNAGLPDNSTVSLVITETVEDVAGNNVSAFISTFTTGANSQETSRPRVSRTIPTNGASGWVDLNNFVIFFTKAMEEQSLEESLKVTQNGESIDVDLDLSSDGRTLTVTSVQEFVSGARINYFLDTIATDLIGNPIYDYSGSFLMPDLSDLSGTRPVVTAYFPISNTPNVPINPVLSASFNEEIDESSINADNVVLYDTSTSPWTILPTTVTFTNQNKVILVTPDSLLEVGTQYYIAYNSSILDTDGDLLRSNYATYFSTADDAVDDDTAPQIVAMSPPQDEQGVGIHPRIALRFDEVINPLTLDNTDNDKINLQFGQNNTEIFYNPRLPFAPDSSVSESVSGIADIANNPMSELTRDFSTEQGFDVTSPTLEDISIVNSSVVPTNTVITLNYSETIDYVSINSSGVYLYDNTARTVYPSTWELSSDGKRLTIIPDEAFEPSTQYYAYAYYLRDLAGNAAPNTTRVFTTSDAEDLTAPTITSSTVSNNQQGVPVNAKLNVRVSEHINTLQPGQVVLTDANSEPVPSIISISRERTLITITPRALLDENADYTLNITGISDISGNQLSSDFNVEFTTSDTADFASSSIATWSIPSGAQDIPLNPLFEVSYYEPIDRATVDEDTIYLYNVSNATRVPATRTLSSDGLTLTLIPNSNLDTDTAYYFYVGYSPYLYDYSGNIVGANGFRSYRTGTEEDTTDVTIESVSIANGMTIMPVNGRVGFRVSEPLSNACPISENVSITQSDVSISANTSLSSDRKTVYISPVDSFNSNTTYKVEIDELCDYAGNKLSNLELVTFTTLNDSTADTTTPSLVSKTPASNASDVALDTTIELEFSEPIERLSTLSVTQSGTAIDGTISFSDNSIIFTPSEALNSATTYRIEYLVVYDFAGRSRSVGATNFTTE